METTHRWRATATARAEAAQHARFPDNAADAVRYFANPGPGFEDEADDADAGAELAHDVDLIAFYLPQFHAFPENDAWWGKGFTEWRNVARATPRFQSHYQPRIPRDLGYYTLDNDAVLLEQIRLAQKAGIRTFCFYYYWFNGKRLLQAPLDRFCALDTDQQFSILWANENWTRRWDGRENDVLIQQDYREQDEAAFLDDTASYLGHPNYYRIDGRPVFYLYRASLLSDPQTEIDRWRAGWQERLGVIPWVVMVQSYDDRDPRAFNCDAALEFPPHKLSQNLPRRNALYPLFDKRFSGQIRHYIDMAMKSVRETPGDYPLFRTVAPSWDNDARREGCGVCLHGATPAHYERWLSATIAGARRQPALGRPSVFINAWNEWAEGAYLEPDVHYGHAWLNATRRALGKTPAKTPAQVLLIGHDAHANGAQMLLLAMARYLAGCDNTTVTIMLRQGGALLDDYRQVAPTTVLDDQDDDFLLHWLMTHPRQQAIVNTTVNSDLLPLLQQSGTPSVNLIHEMPAFIAERQLSDNVTLALSHADHLVFASEAIRDGFVADRAGTSTATLTVQPQGVYKTLDNLEARRKSVRTDLSLSSSQPLIVNLGYADHRKGFDLFVDTARRWQEAQPEARFAWIGKCSGEMRKAYPADALPTNFTLVEFTDEVADWYAAADLLLLSSREDPYPTVVLEAMQAGLPVVIIENATGFDKALLAHAVCAATAAPTDLDKALRDGLAVPETARAEACAFIASNYDLGRYIEGLLAL